MAGGTQAGAVPGRRGVSGVGEDAALAELQRAWAHGGCHGFCDLDGSLRAAVCTSGGVVTGDTPDGRGQQIRAHWQARQ